MVAEKRYCRYCGDPLKGRSDKLYCDDNCRNAYFNDLKKEEHQEIRSIDLALKRNHRILKTFLGESKTRNVTEKQLLLKGFQFKYHTHHFKARNGNEYCYCYDYGYLARDAGPFMIVRELPDLQKDDFYSLFQKIFSIRGLGI
jgi:hypothetical protein